MKKICTVAINSKFTHSSLAVRYFREYAGAEIFECTINDNIFDVFSRLTEIDCDCLAFSVYIWNIEYALKLASMIKLAKKELTIVFGGPEAGFNAEKLLKNTFIDLVIEGEGEEALKQLKNETRYEKIPNLYYRKNGKVKFTKREFFDLSKMTFPYKDEDLEDLKNRIVYFETSRGCLYNCTYCLSSSEGKTRFFTQDYVFKGLDFFIKNNIPLVKFVDRTFNENNERACKIAKYIVENSKVTHFHMEIAPQLISDEFLEIVSKSEGKIQFEIGIQTTNKETMKAVRRVFDPEKVKENILKIPKCVHVHLDLIAGLPFETCETFKEGFNYVYSMNPDMLQMGFLKVLHNTKIKDEAEKYGIKTTSFPPYEVVETNTISYFEMISLKNMEKAVDRIYNSNAFSNTLKSLSLKNPYKFFFDFGQIIAKKENETGPLSRNDLYREFLEYIGDKYKKDLALDFLLNYKKASLPDFLSNEKSKKEAFMKYRKHKKYDGKKIKVEMADNRVFVISAEKIEVIDNEN